MQARMSLQRIILISGSAHISGYIERERTTPKPFISNQEVNILLGGTMMGGILVMVLLICYCCHRKQLKRQTNVPRYWRDPGLSMEVYTVEGSQTFEMHEEYQRPVYHGPPPSYESLAISSNSDDKKCTVDAENKAQGQTNFDMGLPTYEDAVEMARRETKIV